jgi:hypothetical protein
MLFGAALALSSVSAFAGTLSCVSHCGDDVEYAFTITDTSPTASTMVVTQANPCTRTKLDINTQINLNVTSRDAYGTEWQGRVPNTVDQIVQLRFDADALRRPEFKGEFLLSRYDDSHKLNMMGVVCTRVQE